MVSEARVCRGAEAARLHKHGIVLQLFDYDFVAAGVTVVTLSVKRGHCQEFKNRVSTYFYQISDGTGVFYLDRVAKTVEAGDLVVAPPGTAIYYEGQMECTLVIAPPFKETDEVHIRFVSELA